MDADEPDCRDRLPGWTARRQMAFLEQLADGGTVTQAARAAGMSRESAYRLRRRREGALFAALWDSALRTHCAPPPEGHTGLLTDGRLARLLGNHYRRES